MGRSFEDAFEAEFAPLHRYLARRLGGSIADDVAAETFAVAFRTWDRLDPARPVRPWLYGIAANVVRHHWRKERRMLRAYARTGVDPVHADEDAAVERVDAEVDNGSSPTRSLRCGRTSARSSSSTRGQTSRTRRSRPRSTFPSGRSSPGSPARGSGCGTNSRASGKKQWRPDDERAPDHVPFRSR